MNNWEKIESAQEFENYKDRIDKVYGYKLSHCFTPKEYPCMTFYHTTEYPGGDTCHHFFIYKKWIETGDDPVYWFTAEEGDEA